MSAIDRFEALLSQGQDSALIRFSLGNEYLNQGNPGKASEHLQRSVEIDPDYSAAWKLLGRALAAQEEITAAMAAYEQGISVAQARGDVQAAKEMRVFLKRLRNPRQT